MGNNPLVSACVKGDSAQVKALLQDPNIDVNKGIEGLDRTPFFLACREGHAEIVKLLLSDERVDPTKPGSDNSTPFWQACWKGRVSVVKLLLEDERIDVNQSINHGTTPFEIAWQEGHYEVVKALLSGGHGERFDFWKKNKSGVSVFHTICTKRHPDKLYCDLLRLFLNHPDVDINEPAYAGLTPISLACQSENTEVVKILLTDNRINVDSPKSHLPPIFIAGQRGYIELVKIMFASDKTFDVSSRWNGNNLTLIEYINKSSAAGMQPYERSLNETKKRQENCKLIIELIEEYKQNPEWVRFKLRKSLGVLDSLASQIFSLIVLYTDGYLALQC